jgi:hypothetical protein
VEGSKQLSCAKIKAKDSAEDIVRFWYNVIDKKGMYDTTLAKLSSKRSVLPIT